MAQDGTNPNLSILNSRPSALQGPDLLHELVQTSSVHPAIDFLENGSKRRQFSYTDLHCLSNDLVETIASTLPKLENSSPIIPVILPQCPELYVVLLAILKAGKAFCPINIDTPPERLKFMLHDVSADFLITTSAYSKQIQAVTDIRVVLADLEPSERYAHDPPPLPHVHTKDLAYVLYTSGSTGLPKAVSVSHRAVTQSLLAHNRHIPEFGRFLQFAAPTFDVSIFEIFFPWFRGRTLVGCTRSHMLDDLPRTISELEVDVAELTPTVAGNLLHGRASVPSLKLLLTIGEMLTKHVIDEYGGDDTKESMLWAMYGPTEAAIHCTLQSQFSTCSSNSTIGFPLDTVSAFIAAPAVGGGMPIDIEILPIGATGELIIGGAQVAEEYLNRSDLTGESFMDHLEYGRLYRTGDLARIRSDGNIECLGRVVAGQVKLRGQRVELGEIEDTIMKFDGCRAATVLIIEESLVAFCATGYRNISHEDILHTCQRWLPGYMVPSYFLFVTSMPQLPSGKIDKRALESRYLQTHHCNDTPTIDPNDPVAHIVAHVLRQQTKHDLAPSSHLASSGLDSLQAIRIASVLRQEGYNLGAIDILMTKTLGDLIKLCRDIKISDRSYQSSKEPDLSSLDMDDPYLKRRHADITHILKCTPLQEAMLAETLARPSVYCNWIEVELSTVFTFDQIHDALLKLVQMNEILRTGFRLTSDKNSTFIQVVWKALAVSQIHEVSHFSRSYSLGSEESLLRPLSIQVQTRHAKPRLLFQIHHALYDGWSFDLLLQDFDKLLCRKQIARRPQYQEVVRYYAREQRHEEDNRAKEYWAGLLCNYLSFNLPNYNGRVVENTGVGAISGHSTINIETLFARAKELKINPQVFFQAATAYVISLYADSADVVIGNVTSGRTIPVTGVEEILGPCIASIPFRLDFHSLSSVHEILYRTHDLNRDNLQHCTLPLREIAKAAHVQPGTRLFDVLFVWQQSLSSLSDSELSTQILDSADDLEYKITLEFQPGVDDITFRATVDFSTISEDQLRFLAQQIDEVVRLFLRDTGCKVTDINQCFTASSQSIANPKPHLTQIQHGLSRAVEEWAVKIPDKEAIAFGHVVDGSMEIKESVTYYSLNSRANQLSRLLSDNGARQNQLIGVIMEKSTDFYVSILAILKLGSGYLPLVPDTPIDRIRTIMSDAKVKLCISESSISPLLQPSLSCDILDIDLTDASNYSTQNLETPYEGSHLAYAVFTSGSTGTPKGVLVTQDNLMSNIISLSGIYPFSTNSRMLQACSQAFDVSVFEIFFTWHVGICLCVAQKDDLFRDLEAAINCLAVTHLSLTPTVAALVEPDHVPRVEFLVTAGEALTERVWRKWVGRGLYQGYGPSETTNICTVKAPVSPHDLTNNIGPPLDNTSAFVLSLENDTILPRGAIGELCFGGTQVFRGYLNLPELNAAKIIEHPQHGRIYRSGDMGIMLANNSLLFTRRSDDQVKIRGQRVELGEITSVFLDHKEIQDCATLLVSRTANTQTLVTFWVPTMHKGTAVELLDLETFRPTILSLFSLLSRRMPSYMVPSHLVPISRLPMTTQAKIDKRLLWKLFGGLSKKALVLAAEPHEAEEDSLLWSEWEERVAQILAQQLGLPQNDIHRSSSFFNLGLDSVSAISFCNALRTSALADFAVSVVLKNPTIARLASMREGYSVVRPRTPAIDLNLVFEPIQLAHIRSQYQELGLPVAKILPCTPLQEAMLSSRQSPSGSAYCNIMVFDIKGDVSRLQECWKLMGQRHEILRTSFSSTEDAQHAFAQIVLESYEIPWYNRELFSGDTRDSKKVLGRLLEGNMPPVYLSLDMGEACTKLVFCCHHALYDAIAIGTLLKEIQDCYHRRPLPSLMTYDVYLQHMISQNTNKSDQHWIGTFKGFQPTFFPDLTGRARKSHSAASTRRNLQVPLSKVRLACKDASISLLSTIQAAWAKLLHFYTSESDLCFGNVVSGRSLPGDELERLIAPCFNTLPVRVKFDFHNKNSRLLDIVHAFNIESLDYQLTSLRRIQNLTVSEGGRLFDTLVILQQPSAPLDDSVWKLEQDIGEMDLPVVCEVLQDQTKDTLTLVLHYYTSLLSELDAKIVAETFDYCVSSLIKYPHAAANDTVHLPLHLRAESNMDFCSFRSESTLLHHGLEQNALLQPDRIALDFLQSDGTRTLWSFKTLNEKANEIALTLIQRGVRPEDIVPIHMPKGPEFYASVLGILKAGAAFAPLQPELPDARKQFMFVELKAVIVLCSDGCPFHTSSSTADVVFVDTTIRSYPDNPVIQGLRDSNLAYCLFTSGSTGFPKAVSMEHRSPIQTVESSRMLVPWNSSSRLLQYAASTFDMCYYDCFLAWSFGFTLCAAEQSMMLNELSRVINTLNVDLVDLTPSVAASLSRSQVPSVKWLYCIGETLSSGIVQEWNGSCVNSYGPTEAAFCTTMHPVTKDVSSCVIGKPFPSTAFAIFPPQGDRPLPILSIGELYIGGAQLARGYYGKFDLTEKRFVSRCGQRFYKSGDVVRMLSNGDFEFVGRKDDQVKIRGLRVELGEISLVLQDSHPGVATAVAQILKKDASSKEQLVAFITTDPQVQKSELEALRQALKQAASSRLPSYMVPHFFLFVDHIPRSVAGKVDKSALTTIFRDSPELKALPNGKDEHASEHTWTGLEKEVREILVRLSKTPLDSISVATSIYQLGLDSISAVQIAAALRRQGYSVNAADVLKHVTCKDLAAYIGRKAAPEFATGVLLDFKAFENKHIAAVLEKTSIEEDHVTTIRPCTPLQDGMISQFLAREGAVYLNHLRLKLQPNLEVERLEQAWTTVMECHIMLRTGFVHVKDPLHHYAMIEFSPKAVNLPWTVVADIDDASYCTEEWLRNLQMTALEKLWSPLWALRIVHGITDTYLDIGIFHGLFDAQSLQLILDDVATAYQRQILPEPAPLNSVIDGILNLSSQDVVNGKDFWTQLGKKTSPCRFPNLAPLRVDSAPPALHSRASARSLSDLEAGCRAANTTLQAAGIASWLTLLSAYTGESTATCGVVLSGRTFEATEHVVFPCINTVPFACAVTQDKREVLDAVMLANAEIQRYQYTPLNVVQKLMGCPNEVLFDTLFAFQKLAYSEREHSLWSVVDENATVEYPISIELEPNRGRLEYRLSFRPHIVPQKQAILILDQLDYLLESFIFADKSPHIELSFIPSLYSIAPPEEPSLLSEASLLHDFVEITAAQYPQRIAFEFAHAISKGSYSSNKWTYSELDAEGNRIAQLLIRHDVQPGELVGICFEKCPEASFAILGILKAGGAFVAIDPGAPATRQAFIVRDSQARLVLSMASQSHRFKEHIEVPILNLDELRDVTLPKSKPLLDRKIRIHDRSYCLYTSGTTGTPKGCELTHENAVQALLAFQNIFTDHWNAESRWLQFASFHFDVSVLEQYWSWSVGICVVSAPRDLIFEDLANSISSLGITHIDLTPSLAQIIHPDDVPSLCKGIFITGGESLKQGILDVWGPKGVIYNGYGPTEATIGVTMYPRVPVNGKPSNIGHQFLNVGSYVLQPGSDIPVLRGGAGELCVSGKLVGKGYLNRPELTAERFPYLDRFGERVYRTGDIVRMLHDGTFDFLGRADDQVKLRGQRLEVGEINSVIKQSENNISDVATLVLKHPQQQKEQLVAFFMTGKRVNSEPKVLSGHASAIISAREACHEKLPPYMIPTHFIPLNNIPLNVNNKADARKLKEIYGTLLASDLQKLTAISRPQDEEWTERERKLRDVLAEELNIGGEFIDKHTSFYELGMDSITVISVARAVKQAGFANASASVVLRYSTVRQLSKHLKNDGSTIQDRGFMLAAQQSITAIQHRHRRTVAQSLAIDTSAIEAIAPCTPLQQGMIASYLESDKGLYFNSFHFQLSNNIDTEKLQAAWQAVHEANQILRTLFVNTEDGYVQTVLRGMHLHWSTEMITNDESVADCLVRLQQKRSRVNRTELSQPFKVLLVTTPIQKHLVVHIFHGLYDGNSIRLVFKAVWEVYNGRTQHNNTPSFHSALAHGPLRAIPGAKCFWQDHLSKSTLIPFPSLVDEAGDTPVIVTRVLNALKDFDMIRRKLNVTAQAIAQACWLNSLQLYSGVTTTTGIVVSGRGIDLDGAADVVGPMFNTIPYMHQPQRGDTWASVIKRTHEFNTATHPYQHTPLRDIMKWCRRSPSQPLFDTLFVYQVAQGDEEWAKNDAWEISDGGAVTDYAVAIEIEQTGNDCFSLTLVTQGHVSSKKTSNELLDRFVEALQQALADSSTVLEIPATMNGDMREVAPELHMKNNLNGNFEWTSNASRVREEVARLCSIGVNEISETTTIFELGLDSIDAIKLSSKLKRRKIDLPVSSIMRDLTIAKMLPNITDVDVQECCSINTNLDLRKEKLRNHLRKRGLNMDDVENALPLTPLQEAMVAEMISSEYSRYYNYDVLKLKPDTDVQNLRGAWTRIVESSPILRTSFVEVDDPELDDTFVQIVLRKPHNFWTHCMFEDKPDFALLFQQTRADMIKTNGSQPPFNILSVETPGQLYVVISIAHALYDGWSLELLHSDVWNSYEGYFVPRPNYEIPLADILSTSGPPAASFWQDFLAGAQPSAFLRRPNNSSDSLVHRHQQESTVAAAKTTSFARKSNVSLQTLGQTVFAIVVACYTNSLDVTFGSVLSGRDDDLGSRVLFPTMNTVAIRTILHGTHLEMLHYVQDNFTTIKQWQHFPLRKALALAGVSGRLFDSLFIYQKSLEEQNSGKEKLYTSIEGQSEVEYPVCVEMEVVNEEIVWRCAVRDEVLSKIGAKELLDRLDEVMRRIVEWPENPVIETTPEGTLIGGLPMFKEKAAENRIASGEIRLDGGVHEDQPESETAKKICNILAAVSKTAESEITSGTTIFHIGLDSISAIKVSSLLRRQGIVLSVGDMIRAGTVEKMAITANACSVRDTDHKDSDSTIAEALKGLDLDKTQQQAGIDQVNVEKILPITAGQIYMLSMWINTKGRNFYPEFAYELHGAVTLEVIQHSWHALIQANPILRTVFLPTGSDRIPYVQTVLRHVETSVKDVTACEGDETNKKLQKVTSNQPWAHLFVSQGLTCWNLSFHIHHALYDGVSLPLLMLQFQGLCNGIEAPLSDSKFVDLIASGHSASTNDSRKSFWTKYLKDIDQQHLRTNILLRSRVEIFRPALLQSSELEVVARRHGVSTQSLLLASYAKIYALMAKIPHAKDLVIGVYLANRSLPIEGVDQAAVPTVNLLPLHIASPWEHSHLDLASRIQEDLHEISSLANASASLLEISEWTGVKVDTFVNILTLPGTEEPESLILNDNEIKIKPLEQWQAPVSRISEVEEVDSAIPAALINEQVISAYLHAIDVEVTIRNGYLDVGVFAPSELLSQEEGEKLVEDFGFELMGLE